jgi:hypothetical protein
VQPQHGKRCANGIGFFLAKPERSVREKVRPFFVARETQKSTQDCVLIIRVSSCPVSDGLARFWPTQEECHNRHQQEDDKEKLGNDIGRASDGGESEDRRNNGNQQKQNRVAEHGKSLVENP